MRRVATVLVLVVAALMIAACSSGAATDTGSTATPTAPTNPSTGGSVVATNSDILSPSQTVTPGEKFPTDDASVPAAILADLKSGKPMLVYFYDPTTGVSTDQTKEITTALRKYTGLIDLRSIDYTLGLASTTTSSTAASETDKAELLAGSLGVNQTPYIIFVDRAGRITYRFAGFVDAGLLEREVLRATE